MTHLILSGLPGHMCQEIAGVATQQPGIAIYPQALGSARHSGSYSNGGATIEILSPAAHEECLRTAQNKHSEIVVVEFSTPQSVEQNMELFCRLGMPIVCGTSGGNSEKLRALVEQSASCAVVAANMAAEIVLLQSMWEWAAAEFPGAFSGATLAVTESHQAKKRDVSGTAKAFGPSFARLGLPFDVQAIESVRDPSQQRAMGIPEQHLDGHGWHRYQIDNAESKVHLEFIHNVCGRAVYARGALLAACFVRQRFADGDKGKCFNMRDVLRSNSSL